MKRFDLFNFQKRAVARAKLNQIEKEMRKIGYWSQSTRMANAKSFKTAPSFSLWLQFGFIPRAKRATITGIYPIESNIGAIAVREYDGAEKTDKLIQLLSEFDAISSS